MTIQWDDHYRFSRSADGEFSVVGTAAERTTHGLFQNHKPLGEYPTRELAKAAAEAIRARPPRPAPCLVGRFGPEGS